MNADATARHGAPAPIEFWLDLASNYTYLSVMRIEDAARRHAVSVVWRPFLLGPIFRALGWNTPLFVHQKEKGRYVWRDMARECAKYGIPWQPPSTFPRDTLLATRIALLGGDEGWVAPFCRTVMRLNFGDDRDVASEATLTAILADLGQDGEALIHEATLPGNKERLRRQTGLARERGIFGAPTFFVGEEMFWGNDRLDDALRWAAGEDHGDLCPSA